MRTAVLDRLEVLYAFPRVRRQRDRRDYVEELAAIDNELIGADASLDVVEYRSREDLLRALLAKPYKVVVLAGHGPRFGLFEVTSERLLRHCAVVFAEQLAMLCAPNPWILLMGCRSSWLTPELASRGLWGVSFDDSPPAAGVAGFLRGFFATVASGRSYETAFDIGCLSLADADLPSIAITRSFGPGYNLDRGHYYEWLVHPTAHENDERERD